MTAPSQKTPDSIGDLSPEDIIPSVDMEAVMEILRRAHPELEPEEIVARVLEVMKDLGH